MLIFERYFAKFKIQILKQPKYQKDPILGDIIESLVNLKFDFFEDDALKIQNTSLNLEIPTPAIDIILSIENMVRFIEEITILKDNETSNHLPLFVSIDGDPDDLGLYFTITKESKNLFIQIDRRQEDSIIIKMRMKDVRDALLDFANNIQSHIKDMNLPNAIKDSLLNNIGMF